jgi:hypothetical protein
MRNVVQPSYLQGYSRQKDFPTFASAARYRENTGGRIKRHAIVVNHLSVKAMQEITVRIAKTLNEEEANVERSIFDIRLVLLLIFSVVAALNVRSVSAAANLVNFGVLALVLIYKLFLYRWVRRRGYHPAIKYFTSLADVALIYLLMFMYAQIAAPAAALKNYAFFLLFPAIALTIFRYNHTLTWLTGGVAIVGYLGLFIYLYLSNSITLVEGDYRLELFSEKITLAGQASKVMIMIGFVALVAHLARYTRRLFDKLVVTEVNLRLEKESIERELQIAAQVQKELLPQNFPKLPGVEIYGTLLQGRFVGGDYYDFLPLSQTSFLAVVADVSGNGVPAALIMSEVRAATHLLAAMQLSLEELTQRLNALLFKSIERKYFVSFFAAEIDTANGTISYVNAGHPPPLIYSQEKLTELTKGGLPLGVRAALPQLDKKTAPFPAGGMLVAFTDGICERTDAQGEQYGDERLATFIIDHAKLNAEPFVQKLFNDVKNFGQNKILDDDAAIAVVKFCPN